MLATNPALIAVELVAASIWIGGMVCIAIVFQVARNVLDESSQGGALPVGRPSVRRCRHGVAAGGNRRRSGTFVAAVFVLGDHRHRVRTGGRSHRDDRRGDEAGSVHVRLASNDDCQPIKHLDGLRRAMALMTLAIVILASLTVVR